MSINPDLMTQQEIIDLVNTFYDRLDTALCQDVSELHKKGKISDLVLACFLDYKNRRYELEELYEDYMSAKEKFFKQNPYATSRDFDKENKDINTINFRHIDATKDMPLSKKVAMKIPPILIWGSPGIGKSEIVRAIAKQRGIALIDIRLAQKDAIDIKGIPTPNDFKKRTVWYLSSEWPDCPISKGIIFFDELTAADKNVQVAAYEIILERKLGEPDRDGYALPNGWYIASAGNLKSDDAKSEPMSSALSNRLLHVEIDVNVNNWLDWAREADVHPSVIDFIREAGTLHGGPDSRWLLHNMGKSNTQAKLVASGVSSTDLNKPNYLKNIYDVDKERGWPSPRSWERVSSMVYAYEDYLYLSSPENLQSREKQLKDDSGGNCGVFRMGAFSNTVFKKVIEGLIGKAQGQRFVDYYNKFSVLLKMVSKILGQTTYDQALEIRAQFFEANETAGTFDKIDPVSQRMQITGIVSPSRSNPPSKKRQAQTIANASTPAGENVNNSIEWFAAVNNNSPNATGENLLKFALNYYHPDIISILQGATEANTPYNRNPTWALDLTAFTEVLVAHLFADSLIGSSSENKTQKIEDAFCTFFIILQVLFVCKNSGFALNAYTRYTDLKKRFDAKIAALSSFSEHTDFQREILSTASLLLKSESIIKERGNLIKLINQNKTAGDKGFIIDANEVASAQRSSNANKTASATANVNKTANNSKIPVQRMTKEETR